MSPRLARFVAGLAAVAAFAAAGCGGEQGAPTAPAARPAAPEYPPSTAEASKRAQRIALVVVIGGRLRDHIVTSPVQPFARARRYMPFLGPDGPAGPTIFPDDVIELPK